MSLQNFFHLGELQNSHLRANKRYHEFLRVATMSAGVYVLKAGEKDLQSPHREDELYYVVSGKARMKVGGEDQALNAGSIVFVAASVEHRFYDIEEDITLLVFFAPAETS